MKYCHLIFQIPVLLCTIIYTAAYAYIQPFENQWVNIFETKIQVEIFLMLVISSTAQFKVTENAGADPGFSEGGQNIDGSLKQGVWGIGS